MDGIGVAVLAEHPATRVGLAHGVREAGAHVLLESPSNEDAYREVRDLKCGAVLVDLAQMSFGQILACCHSLGADANGPPLTGLDFGGRLVPFLPTYVLAGMRGYVILGDDLSPVAQVVEMAARGKPFMNVPASDLAEAQIRTGGKPPVKEIDLRMLELLGHGLKDRGVGREVGLETVTVRHHIEALEKLWGLKTRFHAGVWAARFGVSEWVPYETIEASS